MMFPLVTVIIWVSMALLTTLGLLGAVLVLWTGDCECDERKADAEGLCHVCRKRT